MFSPEEQQIEICLLKSNLEDIENVLVSQRSVIPALDTENEQKYQDTMTALRRTRSLNAELERLKQENVRLTAKRMQLQRQCEDIDNGLERARLERGEIEIVLKQEEREVELEIQKYEKTLRELATLFRQAPAYFNEVELKAELDMLVNIIANLKEEQKRRKREVDNLRDKLENLRADIPEDILSIMGQNELANQLKSVSLQCETLSTKYNYLLKRQSNII